MVEKLGRRRWPVLLLGETGTGKEVVRALAFLASTWVGLFVTIDCSSLLGDGERPLRSCQGCFRGGGRLKDRADRRGGTTFFDEIGELHATGRLRAAGAAGEQVSSDWLPYTARAPRFIGRMTTTPAQQAICDAAITAEEVKRRTKFRKS
jgi:hypothetical protein